MSKPIKYIILIGFILNVQNFTFRRLTPTPVEMKKLKERADKKKLKLTDYSRIILLDRELPEYEKNIMLTEYATNFRRIGNYMKKEIFTPEERAGLLREIEEAIKGIKTQIKW
ncbi:hypothetical protein [Chryseobacterium sp. 5_R23647]|uniref:hypothetical protein n=1 Tax=Chryseobacterium sp. 5_R23647 TaxID=2258964 RepID=UPI00140334D4|nr:hypothetical protein [Chryseobacterium sp. 5_R23647]